MERPSWIRIGELTRLDGIFDTVYTHKRTDKGLWVVKRVHGGLCGAAFGLRPFKDRGDWSSGGTCIKKLRWRRAGRGTFLMIETDLQSIFIKRKRRKTKQRTEKDKSFANGRHGPLRDADRLAIRPCHVRCPRDVSCPALFDTCASTGFWKFCDIVQILHMTFIKSRPL